MEDHPNEKINRDPFGRGARGRFAALPDRCLPREDDPKAVLIQRRFRFKGSSDPKAVPIQRQD